MQAYHLDGFGDPKGIVLRKSPAPVAGPGEVLVRLRATSINYRDLMVLQRTYPVPASPGTIPLSDGAGEVVAVGPGTTRFAVGDRVAGLYFPRWQGGRFPFAEAPDACQHFAAVRHVGKIVIAGAP